MKFLLSMPHLSIFSLISFLMRTAHWASEDIWALQAISTALATGDWNYTSIVFGPRGNLHYQFVDKLDTYTGLMLGYNLLSSKFTGTGSGYGSASEGGFTYAWFMGGRYFFSEKVAAMLELGYGVIYINVGISLAL